jgi:hypothetical protein
MNGAITSPKTISEIIDRLDLIREELFSLQRSLEMFEVVETVLSATEPSHDLQK